MIPNFYEWKNYKLLFLIPLAIVAIGLAAVVLMGIPQGIDLKGGFLVTVTTDQAIDSAALERALEPYASSVEVRSFESPAGKGFEAELGVNDEFLQAEATAKELNTLNTRMDDAILNKTIAEALNDSAAIQLHQREIVQIDAELSAKSRQLLTLIGSNAQLPADGETASTAALEIFAQYREGFRDRVLDAIRSVVSIQEYSFKEVGSSLSRFFQEQVIRIMLISFALSAIIIFVIFREIAPSFTVIFGAAANVIAILGAMALLQIPLSLATVAALLMLIGFSLDTDILLAIRMLKEKGDTARKRAYDTMQTGILMNLTTIGAFGVLALVGYMLQIQVYYEIGLIAVIGGVADFAITWFGNAPFMLAYLERKGIQ